MPEFCKHHIHESMYCGSCYKEALKNTNARIASLEAQLEKAEAALKFYADNNTWISKNLDKEGNLVSWRKKTPNDISIFPYSIGSSSGNFNCLGRRAREYFAEDSKTNEGGDE